MDTVEIIFLPGSVQCGECGYAMEHVNSPFQPRKPVVMRCVCHRCVNFEREVIMPVRREKCAEYTA